MSVLSSRPRLSEAQRAALWVVHDKQPQGARIGAWTIARPPYDITSQTAEALRVRGLVRIDGIYPDRRVYLTRAGDVLLSGASSVKLRGTHVPCEKCGTPRWYPDHRDAPRKTVCAPCMDAPRVLSASAREKRCVLVATRVFDEHNGQRNDLGLFWKEEGLPPSSGYVAAPGFIARASSFPEGTRLVIVATIELP